MSAPRVSAHVALGRGIMQLARRPISIDASDRRLRVRSSAGFAFVDPSTMSGVDRRVSIRTTLATSPTRALATAASAARSRLAVLR